MKKDKICSECGKCYTLNLVDGVAICVGCLVPTITKCYRCGREMVHYRHMGYACTPKCEEKKRNMGGGAE